MNKIFCCEMPKSFHASQLDITDPVKSLITEQAQMNFICSVVSAVAFFTLSCVAFVYLHGHVSFGQSIGLATAFMIGTVITFTQLMFSHGKLKDCDEFLEFKI